MCISVCIAGADSWKPACFLSFLFDKIFRAPSIALFYCLKTSESISRFEGFSISLPKCLLLNSPYEASQHSPESWDSTYICHKQNVCNIYPEQDADNNQDKDHQSSSVLRIWI